MECTDSVQKPEVPEDGSDTRQILGNACKGGIEAYAWQRYVDFGIVTGSTIQGSTALGCKPYLFACGHQGESDYCPGGIDMKLSCERSCENLYYQINNIKGGKETYKADRHFGKDLKSLPAKDPENIEKIKRVLFTQGSVTAGIDSDVIRTPSFDNEEKIMTKKGKDENHAIRIIGWGKSDKVGPYWIIANSYNAKWNGDGTMKVAFGAAFLAQTDPVVFAQPKLAPV